MEGENNALGVFFFLHLQIPVILRMIDLKISMPGRCHKTYLQM